MKLPSPVQPYLETIKLVLAVLLGCALLWAGQKVLSWREAAQVGEQRGAKIEATNGIIHDGTKADAAKAEDDALVDEGRDTFNTNQKETKRREPETAARADRPVPASVRDNFRKRRLARERSGCAGGECEAEPPTSRTSER